MANAATTSDFLHHKQMERLFHHIAWGGGASDAPTSVWIALFTTIPPLAETDFTTGYEVLTVSTNYARVQVNCTPSDWDVSDKQYSNAADIAFPTPDPLGNPWGSIVGAGIFDADITGTENLLYTAELTTAKTVNAGDGAPKILVGQLRITRADCA